MIEAAWGHACFPKTLASVQKIALLGLEVMIKATGWADLITAYTKFLMQRIRTLMNHQETPGYDDTSAWVNLLHGFTLNNNQAVFAGEKAYNLAISNWISNSGQLAFIIVLVSMT